MDSAGKTAGVGSVVSVGTVSLLLVMALCLSVMSGCASTEGVGGSANVRAVDISDVSGGVAATVNGVEIGENAVSAYIANFRHAQALDDDGDWGQWVFDSGYTVDSLRGETVQYFVNRELIRQAAEREGITVDEADVEAAFEQTEAAVEDGTLADVLASQGTNEEMYRDELRFGLMQNALMEKVATPAEVTDEQVLEQVKVYYPDEAGEAKSLDEVDAEKVDATRQALELMAKQQSFSEWMAAFKAESDVQVNGMPEGLPYIVDLKPYEDAYFESVRAQEEAAAASSDGADSDEGASSDVAPGDEGSSNSSSAEGGE